MGLTAIENALIALAKDRDGNLGVYQNQLLSTYQNLLDKVTSENNMIKKSYPGLSIYGQKSIYINQSTYTLTTINTWLFWIYLAFAVILSIIIILKPYSIPFKVAMVIIICTFPFYIYPVETFIYKMVMYIYSILLSIVYNNGYANTTPEYYGSTM